MIKRNSDNDFLIRRRQIQDGDLRTGDGLIVELIIIDIGLVALGGIDQSVSVDKSEFFQGVDTLHSCLIGLQMLRILQVFFGHQFERYLQIIDAVPEVLFHDLFASVSKFVQEHAADRMDSIFGVSSGPTSQQDDSADQQDQKNDSADRCHKSHIAALCIHL